MGRFAHNKPCIHCKVRGVHYFVYDERTADLICTNCGVVQGNVNAQFLYGTTSSYHAPVHTVRSAGTDVHPHERAVRKREMDKQAEIWRRMTQRFCKDEMTVDRRERRIDEYAEILQWSEAGLDGHASRVTTKAKHFYIKCAELRRRRPIKPTIVATLVVAKREIGHYVNVDKVAEQVDVDDLGAHVIAVCKILKLSHRSRIDKCIPQFVTGLGFPFKYAKHVNKLYERYSRENGSMASNTIMALILHRFYFANQKRSKTGNVKVTLEYIAQMTGTSVTTLNAYIGNGSCTIYPSKKSCKRPIERSSISSGGDNNIKRTKI